ncbi:MAG TPA: hypothetical protein VHT91_43540 [Kofleriaceae bacterium]|nr:hypothetical protein [Kofleriaceae bacterium]
MTRKVDPTELRNAEIHRRAAAEIRRDPRIIEQAAARLERWIVRSGDPPDPALVEWETALAMLDAEQLADFLESPTPRAKRMRISSPFFWPAR